MNLANNSTTTVSIVNVMIPESHLQSDNFKNQKQSECNIDRYQTFEPGKFYGGLTLVVMFLNKEGAAQADLII